MFESKLQQKTFIGRQQRQTLAEQFLLLLCDQSFLLIGLRIGNVLRTQLALFVGHGERRTDFRLLPRA